MKKLFIILTLLGTPRIGAMALDPDEVPSNQLITELFIENQRVLFDRSRYLKLLEVIKPAMSKELKENDRQNLHKKFPAGVTIAGMRQILMHCIEPLEKKDLPALTAHFEVLLDQDSPQVFSKMIASAKILGIEQLVKTAHAFLLNAAAHGDREFVTVLLESGAPVDLTDSEGSTALMRAAREGNAEIVDLLLDRKAAIDKTDYDGSTALMWAAREGKLTAVKRLLARGASKNTADLSGVTILEHAALNNRVDVLTELGGEEAQKDVALFKRKLCAGVRGRKITSHISRKTDSTGSDTRPTDSGAPDVSKKGDGTKKDPEVTPDKEKKITATDAKQGSWFSLQNGVVLGLCAFGAYLYYESTKQSNQRSTKASKGRG